MYKAAQGVVVGRKRPGKSPPMIQRPYTLITEKPTDHAVPGKGAVQRIASYVNGDHVGVLPVRTRHRAVGHLRLSKAERVLPGDHVKLGPKESGVRAGLVARPGVRPRPGEGEVVPRAEHAGILWHRTGLFHVSAERVSALVGDVDVDDQGRAIPIVPHLPRADFGPVRCIYDALPEGRTRCPFVSARSCPRARQTVADS
mmetsp:Transcript_22184/g.44885  ORF Transcript_22184/g.44885 Transcript_22184/m.44885 type:complete len:200 (-) Transcript_22184:140-739(-)|eukprot:CAMPEP_0183300386 /NCGR_PEP_ID=MMETSP0160_2-20130417/6834_1 /TAXON_ID=2839 ORGANISM="Odontella Sinensis, Strain Grunow 1884" /NCGR_SAMPLE_ID=MMETSP0160_2 /ASSEMBLY_ACC=CAM_ASM_000250 /LENGTH=199 /DNA_ID=CAMNT_0025462793 /DNA_START=373 /DNA_END=972 /DNA_ORIENTATION=+